MSNKIHVDLASFKTGFPKEMPVPPLLIDFAKWAKKIPYGTLGYFDSVESEPMPKVFMPEGLDKTALKTIGSKLGIFLHLPDGSLLALWNYGGKAPAVVLIGSEGALDNVSPSLESFLIALSKGKTTINDLDDKEASASRALLTKWLVEQKVKATAPKVPDFQDWLATFEPQPDPTLQKNIAKNKTIDKNANYKEYKAWVDLFGKPADDPEVQHALAQVGIVNEIKIRSGGLSANFQSKDTGMMMIFTDSDVIYKQSPFKSNTPILSGIVLFIQHKKENTYKGPLPFDLKLNDTQTVLRSRFGQPTDSDEDFCWDEWKLDADKISLRVSYTEDFQSIESIVVELLKQDEFEKNANYKEYKAWVDLFGKPADDPEVQHALAQVGVTEKIKLGREGTSANFQSKDAGMMITFADVYSLYKQPPFKSNTPLLFGIILFIQDQTEITYKGPLPYDLKMNDSQTVVYSRFGQPTDSDEDCRWDEWKLDVDKLKLRVTYTKDYQSIKSISIKLLRQ
jgi:hypothetical protein